MIGKMFCDNRGNHVVVLEEATRLTNDLAFPIAMVRVRFMNIDMETWTSRLLFHNNFRMVDQNETWKDS